MAHLKLYFGVGIAPEPINLLAAPYPPPRQTDLACRRRPVQEQALKKAADLQQKASQSAKEGVEGARLVVADLARGDAKQAGTRVGAAVERAGDSAFLMGISRLMVRTDATYVAYW